MHTKLGLGDLCHDSADGSEQGGLRGMQAHSSQLPCQSCRACVAVCLLKMLAKQLRWQALSCLACA